MKNKMLRAIWTLPLVPLFIKRWYTLNELANFVAVHLPQRVVYWTAIEAIQWATRFVDKDHVENLTVGELMWKLEELCGPDPWDVKEES